jgi:RND family efflux transporter MFP subunit
LGPEYEFVTLSDRRALLLSLCATLPFAAACGRGQGAAAPNARNVRAVMVSVAPVAVQDVVYQITAVGSLEAEEIVQVTAEVEGQVSSVAFQEGKRVTPGTVLALIDPDRYRLEAQRAEAAYKKAVADADRAKSELARREALAQEQLVSVEEINRAQGEADRLIAEAEATRAARDIAAQNVQRARVRAPRAGVINTRSVETGRYIKSGDVLATIVDTSRLRLRFKVSEGESLRAHVGQTVMFKVQSLGPTEFPAAIYHVGEVADPATRQVEVLAWVKNPGVLKPGFFAEVSLASESRKAATVVPESAVQASEQGFVSYVVVDDKATVRPVRIGLRTGTGVVEILSGLKPGDTVVVEGSDRLADGVPVQVAQAGGSPGGAGGKGAGGPAGPPSAAR